MGPLRRQLGFAAIALAASVAGLAAPASTACNSSNVGSDTDGNTTCQSFPRPASKNLTTTPLRSVNARVVRIVPGPSASGTGPNDGYALTDAKGIYKLDRATGSSSTVEQPDINLDTTFADRDILDIAIGRDERIFASTFNRTTGAVEIAMVESEGGGQASAPKKVTTLLTLPGRAMLAIDRRGGLFVGVSDTDLGVLAAGIPSEAQNPASRSGKLLYLSDPIGAPTLIDVYASGFSNPNFISLDPDTDEVWLTDAVADGAGSATYELNRITAPGKSFGWPILNGDRCRDGTVTCVREGHVPPVVSRLSDTRAVFYRGPILPLTAHLLTNGSGAIGTIAPYGPSGTPFVNVADQSIPPFDVIGAVRNKLYVATNTNVAMVNDPTEQRVLTESLVRFGCSELVPEGAVAYDVAAPLWSDGAEKSRWVIVPPGAKARVLDDGDIRFPVGTVAGKTFSVDGKKIETRLLIQHSLEVWTGYTYEWNAAESDATLVYGNKTVILGNGKTWYFPSTDDCAACHTPAAGYTLGLEARQILGPNAALDGKLLAGPIDRARFPTFPSRDSAEPIERKARAYLHSNCSICHREGSVTGSAELDLRFDTPLDKTGLCAAPKVGTTLGIVPAADARVVLPKKPEDSVLVRRMRSLDRDARMPKLASHVVDEAGTAMIEEWIRGMTSCP